MKMPHRRSQGLARHVRALSWKLVDTQARPSIPSQWAWHYRTLVRLRERLSRDTEAKLHEAAQPVEAHSLHPADSATDEFDHDLALTLLAAEENALTEVNDAITRIERGRYGICQESGARIPPARLHALPWCRYTLEVEQQLERQGLVTKPKLPQLESVRAEHERSPAAREHAEPEESASAESEESKDATAVAKAATPRAGQIEPLAPSRPAPPP